MLHGAHKYKTMYLVSLDVKTAFDVANWRITAEVHGWYIAALLAEMKDPNLSRHSSNSKDASGREAWRRRTDSVDEAGEVHFVERGGKVGSSGCRAVVRRRRSHGCEQATSRSMSECNTALQRMMGAKAEQIVSI